VEGPDVPTLFRDRLDAGRRLASRLAKYRGRPEVLVLALPRGGVPVAFPVASALGAPLDVFVVRKLGVPGHDELAMGAIARGGVRVLHQSVVQALRIPPGAIDAATERERRELERREREYRGDRPYPDLTGRTVILVDDGLATGSSMRAALRALQRHRPARIVVAVPVAPAETCAELQALADEVVCAETPQDFAAVGEWYLDFQQTTDEEVRELLARAAAAPAREESSLTPP
jgi:putative phosphoribosyl transferase